ncbi:uncharacterized protein LOC110979882 [Acanthaster planci]|uniref:Uncharacterized protein LOC110979882 n=1 Tax=Acanthaster planci TaxID=133434 RepID=A0A8B7YEP3_ACAPL|nr:uncharacterized protein LOC110979882 [Acanthaster planci]
MRFRLIIAVLLWAPVFKTVSSQTFSTISGLSQGSLPISTLPEDCPSTVDVSDIVFISAVPIAIGFGLLLLLAFLQDLRQACKSKRSCPPSPCNIRGNRARKERTYIIDVNYAGRSYWGSFLRWCALHKSSGAKKNPRLMRLQGTTGFSNWLSFDLVLGKTSEQKTLTTPRSIGKLVAVETKYPSASDGFNSRLLPSSNIGACLRGIINRACDIEIKKIHAMDTKTQDCFISGCGAGSGGISSSDQGITTIFPLLLSTTQPASRVNYIAYYLKNGSLWTSAFTPWRQGNFTGSRHITCLFACISYTMVAVQVTSNPVLQPSLGEFVLISSMDFDITVGMVIKAAGVSIVLFPFFIMIEVLCRSAPTILSSCGQPAMSPLERNGNLFLTTARSSQPVKTQSASGSFCGGGGGEDEGVTDEFQRKSVSAPDMQGYGMRPADNDKQLTEDATTHCDNIGSQCATCNNTNGIDSKPVSITDSATTVSDDICEDNQSICPADQLKCHHKLTCHKCPVCHRTTGSRYYDPGAGCSGENTSAGYKFYKHGGFIRPGYAYSSSSLDSAGSSRSSLSSNPTLADLSISSSSDSSKSASISDSSCIISNQPLDESSPYNTQGAIKPTASDDNLDIVNKRQTAPSLSPSKELSEYRPDSISRATSTSGLLEKKHKTTCKWEAGDQFQGSKYLDNDKKMKQEDITPTKFIKYTDALLEPEIKTAIVLRTKNYISRFSDMGKGRWVSLPKLDAVLSEENFNTIEKTDIKSNLSVPGTAQEHKIQRIAERPYQHSPMTTGSDYIINIPLEFEMPKVTIERTTSHKSFFFNLKKWLVGFRSKPKVDVGDDYKLEVTEEDAAIKFSPENNCLPCSHDVTLEVQVDEEAKCNSNSKGSSQRNAYMTIPNTSDSDNISAKMTDDHLKGSIFQSSSHLIEYQPDAISSFSSSSWMSIVSSRDDTNENNNNQVTIIQVKPCDEPTINVSASATSSDADVAMDANQSTSNSAIIQSDSSENDVTHSDGDSASTNSGSSPISQQVFEAQSASTNKHCTGCIPFLTVLSQVLLITSSVLAIVWSVSSFHGLCRNTFLEWVATAIIAILFHALVLDTIKAIILTVIKRRRDKRATSPTPHTVIY